MAFSSNIEGTVFNLDDGKMVVLQVNRTDYRAFDVQDKGGNPLFSVQQLNRGEENERLILDPNTPENQQAWLGISGQILVNQ